MYYNRDKDAQLHMRLICVRSQSQFIDTYSNRYRNCDEQTKPASRSWQQFVKKT